MNRIKRVLAFVMTLTLLLSMIVVPTSAADALKINVTTSPKSGPITAGSEIVVTASYTDWPAEVKSLTMALSFDTAKLSTKRSDITFTPPKDDSASVMYNVTGESVKFTMGAAFAGPATANGTLFTVKFTALQDINEVLNFGFTIETITINGSESKDSVTYPTVISIGKPAISTVSATVADPVKNTALDNLVNVPTGAEYTATVQWFKGENVTGTPVSGTGNAEAGTVYTAKITVKANSGSTFATSVTGPTGYTLARVDDTTLTLTKTFKATSDKDPLAAAGKTVKITGTQQVGNKLTADISDLNEKDVSKLTFKWYRGNTEVSSTNEYTLVAADYNQTLKLVVTANDTSLYAGSSEATTGTIGCTHSGGTPTCKNKPVCEKCNQEYGSTLSHNWTTDKQEEANLKSAATCTAKAVYYKTCSLCGAKGTETFEVGTALGHEFTAEDKTLTGALKTAGTCKTEAVYHKSCIRCKLVDTADTNGTFNGEKDMSNHVGPTVYTYEDATYHKVSCQACGTESTHAAHRTTDTTKFATCQKKAICDDCGREYGNLKPHTMTHHPAVAATCVAKGNVEYWSCSDCNKNYNSATSGNVLTDAEIEVAINSSNHAGGFEYKVNATDPEKHDKICLACKQVAESGLAHTQGTAATCKDKATCKDCGASYGQTVSHTYTKGQYKTVEPKGSIKVERLICDVCGKEATEGDNAYRASISLDMILKVVKASDGTNAVPAGKVFGYTITPAPAIAGLPTAFNFAATKGGDETITQAHLFACSNAEEAEAIKALKDLLMDDSNRPRTWTIQQQTTASADGWTVDGTVYYLKFAITDGNVVTPTITKVVKETKTEIDPATNKEIVTTVDKVVEVQSIEFTNTYKSTSTTPGGNGGTGGGFPFKDSNKTTTDTGKKVESGRTFDGGIALYVGLSVLSLTGSALVIRKKKEF